VVVVEAEACHFCVEARRQLAAFAERLPLRVRVVTVDSVQGRRLIAEHRPALYPLVLVDGVFFSAGRLPRRKLEKLLVERAGAADRRVASSSGGR
jgi:hypothetical protein